MFTQEQAKNTTQANSRGDGFTIKDTVDQQRYQS